MKDRKQKLLALLTAAALALPLSGCAQQEEVSEPEAPVGVAVQVQSVGRSDVATENRVSGSVTSDDETSIYVASSAKCVAVYFEAGDTVKKGDKICTLDLGSTQASYNAAKISYDSAVTSYNQQQEVFERQLAVYDSQIELYERTLENTKALFEIGAASQLEVDQAQLQLDGALLQRSSTEAQRDSSLAQLRAGMENYRSNLEQLGLVMDDVDAYGNVIAPAGGILASLNVQEGSFVAAGYPVAVISNAEQMKITANVSESLVTHLAVGDTARVSVSAAGAEFTGVIRSVEQSANPQTRLYGVVLSVPSETEGLVSGMFADLVFYTDASEAALTVPSEAILTADGQEYVFVVENGTAKRVGVTTGLTGTGVTEVLTGLSEGQQLVVIGQQYLSDGDPVRVVGGL